MNTNDLFQFPLGTLVSWGTHSTRYLIVSRRYTERDLLGPVIEYLLRSCAHPAAPLSWAYEPDVCAVEDDYQRTARAMLAQEVSDGAAA